MQGSLRSGNLADVIRSIVAERRSGLLFLKHETLEKGIYFTDGEIVNAESNQREEGLGYALLDLGLLTPQALEAALRKVEPGVTLEAVLAGSDQIPPAELDRVRRSLAERVVASAFDWRDGSYYFQEGDFSFKGNLGLSTPAVLVEGVRRLFDFDATRERLLADRRPLQPLFGSEARLPLEPAEGFILSRVDGTLSAADICALSLLSEEMTCRVLYGLLASGVIGYPAGSRPASPAAVPAGAPTSRPAPSEAASPGTAERHRPPETAGERTATARRPPETAGERTAAPRRPPEARPAQPASAPPAEGANRAASRAPGPAAAALAPWQQERVDEVNRLFETHDRLNYYAILGLPREAPTSAVEQAFARLNERLHPVRNTWVADDTLRSKLVFVFAKIKLAYETLRDGRRRIDYDESLRRHDKEAAADSNIRMEFSKTDKQIALEERLRDAEAAFAEARRLFDADRMHAAHERVLKAIQIHADEARFHELAARIEMLNPNMRWQKDAENHFRRAIELDPWNAELRVGLATLYKNAGLRQKARREFIRALELDAANPSALAEVPPAERPTRSAPPTTAPEPDEDVEWT